MWCVVCDVWCGVRCAILVNSIVAILQEVEVCDLHTHRHTITYYRDIGGDVITDLQTEVAVDL